MTSTAPRTPGAPGGACPHCGWPDDAEPFQVLSRHSTGAGYTVWTRCGCGSLQVRAVNADGVRIVSRSRPAEAGHTLPDTRCGR
ncbi:hypothetical protein [Streptomyces cavernae]|uniref:hypothetical protein n=1 Tax=Streptomyces cavernae TaxID=2259034 RepID=UPI000FEB85F2|nr:hypothetical protein [Streptomyces cavernae]